jgi:hypothetical protein
VDEGASKPGWLEAGQLRVGDRLREADGTEAVVAGLRRNVGQAVVYTLTVARDHTFFVGSARVLVHNATCYSTIPEFVKSAGALVNWLRSVQNPAVRATKDEADRIVELARKYGLEPRLDPPHAPTPRIPDQKWTVPHLNIGDRGQAHVAVPDGYTLPPGS